VGTLHTTRAVVMSIFLVVVAGPPFQALCFVRQQLTWPRQKKQTFAFEGPGRQPDAEAMTQCGPARQYGEREILHGVSFDVMRGETMVFCADLARARAPCANPRRSRKSRAQAKFILRRARNLSSISVEEWRYWRKRECRFRAARLSVP